MAENLDVLNAAVSLLIRVVLLAARFFGRLRLRTRAGNRAAKMAALMVNETAQVITSKFLFIKPLKPPPEQKSQLQRKYDSIK